LNLYLMVYRLSCCRFLFDDQIAQTVEARKTEKKWGKGKLL
jgi:hypothetical protein